MAGLEVLVSALENDADALPVKMNLHTDAVIINQSSEDSAREIETGDGKRVRIFECNERGVGRSRNRALSEAEGEIILFSDEDIILDDDYEEKVLSEFDKNPDADLILFNFEVNENRRTYWIEKNKRVWKHSCGRYPAYSAAARLRSLQKANVKFSLLFGGGAPYSNGEDSLFFTDCLRAGLKIVAVPVKLGKETYRDSTWFKGYTEKFFYDRGVLFHFLYGKAAVLWAARFAIVKRKTMCREIPPAKAFNLMKKGIEKGKSL
ncbi:MAG: Glycosyl transferase family 2 [Firmicutes bacterium ADurb.Bin354]|nr:MAG: Glycosyl transferase family 2 [Firmicutes bacterium ADurb.Bin354]